MFTPGRRVKTIRTLYNMSQQELADKANIKRTHLSYFENDLVTLKDEDIQAIETALGVELDDPRIESALSLLADTLPTTTTKKNASLTLIAEPVF